MRSTKAIAKWFTGAALAGALLFAAPHKVEAQVTFGVAVGAYPAPGFGCNDPVAYDAYARRRWIEHEQHEQWEAARAAEWRHEQWQREHDDDRHWDRDRRDHDWRDHDRY